MFWNRGRVSIASCRWFWTERRRSPKRSWRCRLVSPMYWQSKLRVAAAFLFFFFFLLWIMKWLGHGTSKVRLHEVPQGSEQLWGRIRPLASRFNALKDYKRWCAVGILTDLKLFSSHQDNGYMNPNFQSVGEAFVKLYYETFDGNRAGLAPLYVSWTLFSSF